MGQRGRQLVGELGERPAVLRPGRQRAVQRGAQLRREVLALAAQRRQHRAEPARGRRGAPGAHRVDARQTFVEHERERVEVGALVDAVPVGLLRGHVGQRPDDVAGARQRRVARQVGDAEVGQLRRRAGGARAVGDDHVLGLDVAVDDAAAVRVLERVGEREADPQHVAVGQLALGGELVERAPAHELGHEVARVAVLARVEDRHDPGVVEPRGGQRLARRPLGRGARHPADRDHLDGDVAVEALVDRRVDRPEAPGAQPRPEAVAPQHGWGRTGAGARRPAGELLRGLHRSWVRRRPRHPCRGARADCDFLHPGLRSYLRPDVSFFDEDDEPRSRAPRPRRAAGGDVSADTQTIRIRQAVLAIGFIVIVLLLLFVVRSCQNSAKENALKDYNREVASIADQSSQPDRRGVLHACSARAAATRRRISRARSRASRC